MVTYFLGGYTESFTEKNLRLVNLKLRPAIEITLVAGFKLEKHPSGLPLSVVINNFDCGSQRKQMIRVEFDDAFPIEKLNTESVISVSELLDDSNPIESLNQVIADMILAEGAQLVVKYGGVTILDEDEDNDFEVAVDKVGFSLICGDFETIAIIDASQVETFFEFNADYVLTNEDSEKLERITEDLELLSDGDKLDGVIRQASV